MKADSDEHKMMAKFSDEGEGRRCRLEFTLEGSVKYIGELTGYNMGSVLSKGVQVVYHVSQTKYPGIPVI